LYDTRAVLGERYWEGSAFDFAPELTRGNHLVTAIAMSYGVAGPRSAPLRLTVDPQLPYDPMGVSFSHGADDGEWFSDTPIGRDGCIDPTDGWYVRPIYGRELDVSVPVVEAVSAVTVTLGARTRSLARGNDRAFSATFGPMNEGEWAGDGGHFTIRLTVADGVLEVPGRVLWSRVFLPLARTP
jgi:hypothetical protein